MRLNRKAKRKNRISKFEIIKLAVVSCTIEELKEIGIDENITGMMVKVYDIDKFNGIGGSCSKVVIDQNFDWLRKHNIEVDYIIPTKFLKIL